MADDFRRVITELWTKLNLGRPVFGATEDVVLTIDGLDVSLQESPDGRHLVIAGTAGRLSADPRLRGEQVRRLLKANLGYLLRNRAGVSLQSRQESVFVHVEAVYAYSANRLDQLVSLIEEVLHRVEVHKRELAGASPAQQRRQPEFAQSSHEDFIFRP